MHALEVSLGDQAVERMGGPSTWSREPWDDGAPVVWATASRVPNPFGLFEICGNVREMCADVYDERAYATLPTQDPLAVATPGASDARRVVRDGSFMSPAAHARAAARYAIPERGLQSTDMGVRLARPLQP